MVQDPQPILVETRGRVGLVTLNRPRQLNALNDALMDALGEALLAFDADAGIGAIVITGSDKAFAAGADIDAMAGWDYAEVSGREFITRNWETIRRVRKPVIAAVAGYAMGGGCELALACDIVVAARSARFALPEIKLAMLPGAGGTQRLPHAIGKAKAMDMCLSARALDADEADRYGLVSRVVEPEDLLDSARALAQRIAVNPPQAVRMSKRLLREGQHMRLDSLLELSAAMQALAHHTQDHAEAVNALLEKRPGHYSGA